MSDLRTKIVSIGTLSAGILLTLVGLAGLVLPIIPGFVLILAGLWMIGQSLQTAFAGKNIGVR